MPEETAGEAVVHREARNVVIPDTIVDRKFILALVMIVSFGFMLAIPLLTNNITLFKDVAAALSGFVGTIIGYYFGTSQEE